MSQVMSVKTFIMPSISGFPRFISSLLSSEKLADVRLYSSDYAPTWAHKLVLSASSKFFRAEFLSNPEQNMIFLSGTRQRELQSILELLYLGQTSIGVDNVEAFIEAAKVLQITGYYEENGEETANDEEKDKHIDRSVFQKCFENKGKGKGRKSVKKVKKKMKKNGKD